jgi:hypothetical protein
VTKVYALQGLPELAPDWSAALRRQRTVFPWSAARHAELAYTFFRNFCASRNTEFF